MVLRMQERKAMSQVIDRKGAGKTNGQSRVRLLDLTGVSPEKGVDRLIERAIELRASDLFIVTNEQHVAVQVRLRGQIEQLCILDDEQGKRFIARIRHEAGMDVSDHRRPPRGRWVCTPHPRT